MLNEEIELLYIRFIRLKFYISYCSNIFLSRLLNFKLSISNPISLSNHCLKKKKNESFTRLNYTIFRQTLIIFLHLLHPLSLDRENIVRYYIPASLLRICFFLLVQDFQSKYLQGISSRGFQSLRSILCRAPSLRHGSLNGKKLEKRTTFCR